MKTYTHVSAENVEKRKAASEIGQLIKQNLEKPWIVSLYEKFSFCAKQGKRWDATK